MQLSKKRMSLSLEKQTRKMLLGVLTDERDVNRLESIFNALFTESEQMAAAKRLAIAVYLDKGRSYENIRENLKVSSATIATVAEQIGDSGYQELIKRVKAEEWAENWSKKLGKNLRKFLPV